MPNYNQDLDQAAYDQARTEKARGLLHNHNPRFDSAQQFGFFCRIVIDEWQHSTPGLSSSWEIFTEMERLGVKVQTSLNVKHIGSHHMPVYHVSLIRSVLEQSVRHIAHDHPDRYARDSVQAWGQMDILGRTKRGTAKEMGLAPTTLYDRVIAARDVIYLELVREGMADRNPASAATKNRRMRHATA